MASQSAKFTVGLFVAAGLVIAISAVIWLGMSKVFEEGKYYVTYFSESIQGLDVDSPVKFRGVPVGRVVSISVAPDSELIQVVLKLETDERLSHDTVAQLTSVGITGAMFIELNLRDPGEPDRSPKLTFPARYPVVPSRPSNLTKLLADINSIVHEVRGLDLKGISTEVKGTLSLVSELMEKADIAEISDKLLGLMHRAEETLDKSNRVVGRMDNLLETKEASIASTLDEAEKLMKNSNMLVRKGIDIVEGSDLQVDRLQQHLMTTARNLEVVSDKLNRLADTLSEQPSRLLFGKPAPAREVER
jgi:phospholipid/cholesterol/gamma-HCH transport system substrate-binding protein